jgi:hypothetical protein
MSCSLSFPPSLPPSLPQVDAFTSLGHESNIKGWKTEDRPALQDIYGVKKGKNGNVAEQLAA